ncbi:helix-turn-helix domain-containing protein [Phycisphaerales bacterium AB-hyl4]|uniref:Helix-turn-helix domain-containing protein n=1 Tax=Natronomicrosphaera hydrolytica TaxID=3242702 RepID=A0ABV4U9K2_9BACT
MSEQERFSEQIRQQVRASGLTRYRISMESGIPQSTLSRFMAGHGMSMANVDDLARLLGLSVKRRGRSAARGK